LRSAPHQSQTTTSQTAQTTSSKLHDYIKLRA
jgi:hypothetical protein